jgi:exopolysaccharide production protein ExoQ
MLEGVAARAFRAFEATFSVVAILILSGAFFPLYIKANGGSVVSAESVPLLRNLAIGLYLVALPLSLVRHRAIVASARRHLPTLALVGMTVLSVVWSADPGTTLRRSIAFVGTTLVGLYLAARYELGGMMRITARALFIAGILSVVFAVAIPSWGLDTGVHAGDWRGIYSQKNTLAEIMVLSTVLHLLLWRGAKQRNRVYLAGLVLSIALVLLSSSKTALGAMVTLVALAFLYRTLRWSATLAVPLLAGCILAAGGIALVTLANADVIFSAMGKEPTLTGRTPIWLAVLDMIGRRPILGYGYSAFWGGLDSPSAPVLLKIGWHTPHSHNGFLDILLQLGAVGMAVFLYGVWTAGQNGVRMVRESPRSEALWPLLFLSFLILYNITETTVLQQNNIYWTLYAATVFAWMTPRMRRDPSRGDGT